MNETMETKYYEYDIYYCGVLIKKIQSNKKKSLTNIFLLSSSKLSNNEAYYFEQFKLEIKINDTMETKIYE